MIRWNFRNKEGNKKYQFMIIYSLFIDKIQIDVIVIKKYNDDINNKTTNWDKRNIILLTIIQKKF